MEKTQQLVQALKKRLNDFQSQVIQDLLNLKIPFELRSRVLKDMQYFIEGILGEYEDE